MKNLNLPPTYSSGRTRGLLPLIDVQNPTPSLTVAALTAERFARTQERTATQQGLGSTDAGLAVVSKYLKESVDYVKSLKMPQEIDKLSPELVALVCLQIGLASVGSEDTLSQTVYSLGRAAEREVYAFKLTFAAQGCKERQRELARIVSGVCKRNGSLAVRKTALRAAAQRAGLGSPAWPNKTAIRIGGWLLDVCLASEAFTRVLQPVEHVTLTVEASGYASDIVEALLDARPAMLPLTAPPEPWVSNTATISGYRHHLVRKRDPMIQSAIRADIKSGRMSRVLEAVNGIQNVAFRINPVVLDMIEWSYGADVVIEGFPRRVDLAPPSKGCPWEDMTEDQRRLWKKNASDVARANRSNGCDRLGLASDLGVARHVGDRPFWLPANMDYRGRIYTIGNFNFQRRDHIRALFLFETGKPLDADGLYWLKVHAANCGDFDKASKLPFDERVAWVDQNWPRLKALAEAPKDDLWWTEADKPFLFLAAVAGLLEHDRDPLSLCRVPVSFDGSCSGLQHLAAMTHCHDTAGLVNLAATDRPGDIYLTVAALTERAIQADLGSAEFGEVAAKCLAYGIGRNLVKRNVMTYSYSSGRFGMGNQHMEDTMYPLALQVLEGKLSGHPFLVDADTTIGADGAFYTRAGYTASRYLAARVYAAIEATVTRPAVAMRFLQSLARATAHESKPLIWHTPLGLPVVLRYPVYDSNKVTLFLHDKGVRLRKEVRTRDETPQIDKARAAAAVAPGFVHSMDACHLQEVVRRAAVVGIESFVFVHDSFGCLPTDAERFRSVIKTSFDWLYSNQNVLADIRLETLEQIDTNAHRLAELPDYGSYNSQQIMKADYAFA